MNILKHILVFLFVCSLYVLHGQNLVPNPGFENYSYCPFSVGEINAAVPWTEPVSSHQSADYYNTCALMYTGWSYPTMYPYVPTAAGNAYAGIFLAQFHPTIDPYPVREYLMTPLISSLIHGDEYVISFKVRCSKDVNLAVNSLGVYFSQTPLTYWSNYPSQNSNIPVTPQHTFHQLLSDTTSWTTLSFNYIATGNEQYMTIGIFADDTAITIIPLDSNAVYRKSYIYIDEVYVESVTIHGPSTICAGEQITLTAAGENTYFWATANAPNSIIGMDSTLTVSPANTTTYYVYGANDTATFTVNVNPMPVADLGNDTSICQGNQAWLSAYPSGNFVPGTQYDWQDGTSGAFFSPTQSGIYSVTATLNNCVAIDTIVVTIKPTPIVNLGPDKGLCPDETLILNAAFPNASHQWQDGSAADTFLVVLTGTYFVTVDLDGCIVSDTIEVNQLPYPIFDLGHDMSVCEGIAITLNATVPGAIYQWQDNSSASTFSPTQSGICWVQVSLGNCVEVDSIHVEFNPLPYVNLGNDSILCQGSLMLLDAWLPNASYNWQDNSNTSIYTATQSGIYSVTVTDSNGCENIDSIILTFINPPALSFIDSTLCNANIWILDVTAPYATYLWQDKSVLPTFTIGQPGTYWVIVANSCGTDSDSLSVDFRRCDCDILVPNSFTSNQDGINEIFNPIVNPDCILEDYTFTVFDRWGGQIFESRNIEYGWNGTLNGHQAPIGLYSYRILYKFEKTPQKLDLGSIVLLR